MSELSDRIAQLPPDRRATLERALAERAQRLRGPARAAVEPVAVVGMACRFPGGAGDPEAFWRLLDDGVDATTDRPPGRWDAADAARYPGRGGFLTEPVAEFDAAFFGISGREAEAMDPQQRLLLEVTWAALEDAGQSPGDLAGSRTGVWVGIGIDDYKLRTATDPADIDGYSTTGTLFCVAAGRVSHQLGLTGPSMAVDTGCSSSLVAVHLAGQSLRAGECDLALASGVHLMLAPAVAQSMAGARALSADGRCRTFDAAAGGYARGEGCGVVVLKLLRDAVAAGDRVLGVIRGSAVNHDGPSGGLTVPSGPAQRALITTALAAAAVPPAAIDYVEAHGTGTPLGDPIEVGALGAALGADRAPDRPLLLGAVKTNIGHLEAAAGMAGLLKVLLALRHDRIPATLHQSEPNPRIDWAALPVEVVSQARPWPRDRTRRAGISSFGIGGTNAHLVVEDAPSVVGPPGTGAPVLVPVAARSATALQALAAGWARRLRSEPDLPLADLARTAGRGRTHWRHRAAVVAGSTTEAADLLAGLATGPPAGPRAPRVGFVFSGQGSQRAGMGRGLYAAEPVFRDAVDSCTDVLAAELDAPVRGALLGEPSAAGAVHDTTCAQPAIFVLQYALVALWRSWGVEPAAVLGHSVGEVAAACAAGVLDRDDALRLVARRARLMGSLPPGGVMVSVLADPARVAAAVAPHAGDVAVAAVNGPTEVVVSGRAGAVAQVVAALEADGVRTRALTVSHAFHSPLIDPVLAGFEEFAATLEHRAPGVPMVSTTTGRRAGPGDLASAAYWRAAARGTVRFHEAACALRDEAVDVVVEIGADPVLCAVATRSGAATVSWFGSLRAGRDDRREILGGLGRLYTAGVEVDWGRVHRAGSPVSLPTYPFERTRYWRTGATRGSTDAGRTAFPGRPLRSPALVGDVVEARYTATRPAFVTDHLLFDEVVVPGAAHLSMVLATAGEDRPCTLGGVTFPHALVLGAGADRAVQLVVDPGDGPAPRRFRVVGSGADGGWTTHATGTIDPAVPAATAGSDPEAIRARLPRQLPGADLHASMAAAGYHLGSSFRWITTLHVGPGEVLAVLDRPDTADEQVALQPGLLDSLFQAALAADPPDRDDPPDRGDPDALRVPVLVDRVVRHGGGSAETRFAHLVVRRTPEGLAVDAALLGPGGTPVLELRGALLRRVPRAALTAPTADRTGAPSADRDGRPAADPVLRAPTWTETAAAPTGAAPTDPVGGRWLVVADAEGPGPELVAQLTAAGARVERVGSVIEVSGDPDVVVFVAPAGGDPVTGVDRCVAAGIELVHRVVAGGGPARVVVVTCGSQAAAGSRVTDVAQAALWGLVRVARTEHPGLDWRLVDLDADEPDLRSAAAAVLTAARTGGAGEVAVRGGRPHTPGLEPVGPGDGLAVAPDAVHLVTGGLGALGCHVARALARAGCRHLVLAGPRPPTPAARAVLAELERDGVSVTVVAADVTSRAEVTRLMRTIGRMRHPLRGVVHAAGVLDDGVLLRQSAARAAPVTAAKAVGAWHLHEELRGTPLDHFVLFSSAAGMVGPAGQGTYAAANAVLDALAHHRRGLGLPAVSIAWGSWSGTGMAARLDRRAVDRQAEVGLRPVQVDAAVAAFGRALTADEPVLAAWPWAPEPVGPGPEPGPDVAPRPAGLGPYVPPRTAAERSMARIWEVALGVGPLGVSDDFFEIGGDSILSLQVVERARAAGFPVVEADLFACPTITELLGRAAAAAPPPPTAVPSASAAGAAPEDVARLLARLAPASRLPEGLDA